MIFYICIRTWFLKKICSCKRSRPKLKTIRPATVGPDHCWRPILGFVNEFSPAQRSQQHFSLCHPPGSPSSLSCLRCSRDISFDGGSGSSSTEGDADIPRFVFLPPEMLVFVSRCVPIRQSDFLSLTSIFLLSEPYSEGSRGQERAVGVSRLPWRGEGHLR